MGLSLTLGMALTGGDWLGNSGGAAPQGQALALIGGRQGFAIDFVNRQMIVNDAGTPANAFNGDPESKLTRYGTDPYEYDPAKGLNLSASRDFGIAIATDAFPYNPSAIHIFARFELNSGDSTEQRYLLMVDNAGNDRFAVYTTSGLGFRLVTGGGDTADTEVSSLTLAGGVEYRMFLGADAGGRTWIDDGGVQTNDQLLQLAAAAPSHIGIGGYNNQVLRNLDGYLAEIAVICEPLPMEGRLTLDPLDTVYGAEGDSHTFNISFGLNEAEFYPARVADAMGPKYKSRNVGGSGDSSAEMVAQLPDFLDKGAPDIASIYAGSNDGDAAVAASPAPSSSVFSVTDSGDAGRLAAGGWVIINGESREIASVNALEVTLANPLSTAPVAADVVEIDTQKNIETWVAAVQAAGAGRVLVIGSHYLNFASAGDTVTTEQSLRGAVRIKQQAAATAMGVEYVDTYAHMRQKILDGFVAQGDWTVWHQGETNTHLTAAGEQVVAEAIVAVIGA